MGHASTVRQSHATVQGVGLGHASIVRYSHATLEGVFLGPAFSDRRGATPLQRKHPTYL